ncbi:hypothetical protein E3N88_09195 [Mikania micrantha]|uniref:Uncharacterized protein n=1 Tax=Mikania micrantha TaxID=192012 RepID=A0A5N6PIC4_9ASTR|nr:hypothetical protein E3N88_09195 [Mikania micrantha]
MKQKKSSKADVVEKVVEKEIAIAEIRAWDRNNLIKVTTKISSSETPNKELIVEAMDVVGLKKKKELLKKSQQELTSSMLNFHKPAPKSATSIPKSKPVKTIDAPLKKRRKLMIQEEDDEDRQPLSTVLKLKKPESSIGGLTTPEKQQLLATTPDKSTTIDSQSTTSDVSNNL